jgi:peptidoglycan/xylan/chitin deacetylase (PgdA/CDA1 family)
MRAASWRRAHRDFLIVFNWHQVSPQFDPKFHHQFTWTSLELFASQVQYVRNAYTVLPLHQAVNSLRDGKLRGPCAAMTFDDGDVTVREHVLPVLKRLGAPATFFINTAYLDGGAYWFPILEYMIHSGQLPPGRDANALREMATQLRNTPDADLYRRLREEIEPWASSIPSSGMRSVSREWLAGLDGEQFSIGAHGHEHQRYAMMSERWQQEDLATNVKLLREYRAFRPIFAVPFGRPGDWTQHTLAIAREQGLDVVLADGGVNLARMDAYARIPCDGRQACAVARDTFASLAAQGRGA